MKNSKQKPGRLFRPALEQLEDRALPGGGTLGTLGTALGLWSLELFDQSKDVVALARLVQATGEGSAGSALSATGAIQPAAATTPQGTAHSSRIRPLDLSTLNSSFDLDHDGKTDASSSSSFNDPGLGQKKTVTDTVGESLANTTFKFSWTVNGITIGATISDTKSFTNSWNTFKNAQGTAGGIGFTPGMGTNQQWGGNFTASRYATAGFAQAQVGASLDSSIDVGSGAVQFTSDIQTGNPSGYLYHYKITNNSSEAIAYSWAGFSGNLAPGAFFEQFNPAAQLTGGESDGAAQITFSPGLPNANVVVGTASFWQP